MDSWIYFLDFNDALDDVGDNSLGEGVILPAVNLAIFYQ